MPTRVLPELKARATRQRGTFWPRSLRWRLILTYAVLLAVLLAAIGIALNIFIRQTLYRVELEAFHSDTTTVLAVQQHVFDQDVLGKKADNCAAAMSYADAFQQAIVAPLTQFYPSGVQSVYLLDRDGVVIAASHNAQAALGAPSPVVPRSKLAAFQNGIRRAALANARASTASDAAALKNLTYQTTDSNGARVGVELVPIRYYTQSVCATTKPVPAIGALAVTTGFQRAQAIMSVLHIVLLAVMLSVFALGLAVGAPLTARALRPLTRMTSTARRIAEGDLGQRVRLPHTGDEIGQLGSAFDEMIERIQYAFAMRQASENQMRQFIADASHELRTPLTSIRGFIDVLLRGAKDDPATAEEVLRATQREAERMTRLVTDLLTLARFDAGRPLELQPLDLIALCGEAVDQARILAGQREVTLQTDGRGSLELLGDADRLKQVLLVLLDNALKYGRTTPDGWVRVTVERIEGGARLRVSDNGLGIAAEDLPHIFDRFYRAERAARQRRLTAPQLTQRGAAAGGSEPLPSGSGLGLSIARAIVQAHGGSIDAQSEVGVGTTFTILLPHAPPAAAPIIERHP